MTQFNGGPRRRRGWKASVYACALAIFQLAVPTALLVVGPRYSGTLPLMPEVPGTANEAIGIGPGARPGSAHTPGSSGASTAPEAAPTSPEAAPTSIVAAASRPSTRSSTRRRPGLVPPGVDPDSEGEREGRPHERPAPPEDEGGEHDDVAPDRPFKERPVLLASVEDSVAPRAMTLESFGQSGTAVLAFHAVDPEDPGGCAVRSRDPVVIPVTSSDESVAVVTPGAVQYDACSGIDRVTVHPVSQGVANIELGEPTEAPADTRIDLEATSFEVEVVDSLPRNLEPTVEVPSGMLVETEDPGGAVVSWERVAHDREDGLLVPTCTPPAGALFPIGTTEVICSTTDSGGLSDTATFAVTVVPYRDPATDPGGPPEEPPAPEPRAPDTAKPYAPSLDLPSPDFVGATGAWHRDAVTIAVRHNGDRFPDGSVVSGVDPTSYRRRLVVAGSGVHTIAGITVADRAGNESNAAAEVVVRIDASPPVVHLTCPAGPVEVGGHAAVTWTAHDDESGLATVVSGTLPLDTSSAGRREARLPEAAAVDNVGHLSAAVSCSYLVQDPDTTQAVDRGSEPVDPERGPKVTPELDAATREDEAEAEAPSGG